MEWITIWGIVSYWWAIPSSLLCLLIYQYINGKAPGHQSLLDLLIKEYLIVCITRNFATVLANYLGLLYGQIEATLAEVFFAILINLGGVELAMVQVLLLVKYLLIFKADWIVDREDSEVIWSSRRLVMVYAGIRFMIDMHLPANSFHTLNLLTGIEMKTKFGPGLGMLIMLVILLSTFIYLKIKTPSLPEDNSQDQNSTKIWLGIAVFAMAIIHLGFYLLFQSPLALTLFSQSFHHWIIKVGFLIYFIYKTPNLCNYIKNYFQQNVTHPINEFELTTMFQPPNNQIDVIV